jgi:hypothetical protein
LIEGAVRVVDKIGTDECRLLGKDFIVNVGVKKGRTMMQANTAIVTI